MTRPADPLRLNALTQSEASGTAEMAPLRNLLEADTPHLRGAGPSDAQKEQMWAALVTALPELSAATQSSVSIENPVAQQVVWTSGGMQIPFAQTLVFGLLALLAALPPSSHHPKSLRQRPERRASVELTPAAPKNIHDSNLSGGALLKQGTSRALRAAVPEAEALPSTATSSSVVTEGELGRDLKAKAKMRRRRRTPRAHQPQPTSDRLAEELRLLQWARAQAHTKPEQALELVAQHEQRHPQGHFVQEREVIAIHALVTLDRHAQAEERARRFLRTFPRSAHRRRIRWLLRSEAHDALPLE